MIYATYNVMTGALVDLSDQPSSPSAPLALKQLDRAMPNLTVEFWDAAIADFSPYAKTERNISGVQYLRRFSQDERIAIRDAAKQSPKLDDYLKLLDATIAQGGVIDLNDRDTIDACALLEAVGLIAPGRAAEVLA